MMALFLWEIVVAGLIGLAALGLAAHALVQAAKQFADSDAGGRSKGPSEDFQDPQELERLRQANIEMARDLEVQKSRAADLNSFLRSMDKKKQEALENQEKTIRQEYAGLEEKTQQLAGEVRALKAEQAEAAAVKASIEEVAPYVYSYGDWYHDEEKGQQEGRETSALWRLCQGNQEMCGRMLEVFHSADGADRQQMYVHAAQLYETAYQLTQDAATLAEVKANVDQLLAALERGGEPLYELRWPEAGTRWDDKTTKRQEENGQSTILSVVRPIVFDLKNMTVFSRGIVKTGG